MATVPSQDTIKAVVAAVRVFSGQPDKTSLAAANTWLQDFQHTVSSAVIQLGTSIDLLDTSIAGRVGDV